MKAEEKVARRYALSTMAVWLVVVVSVLPFLLHLAGVDFNARNPAAAPGVDTKAMIVHSLLEWTACGVAVFVLLMAVLHYSLRGDVTIAIIGLALFSSGIMDAFHVLAADGFIHVQADGSRFMAFSWSLSRTFNAGILIVGAAIFLVGHDGAEHKKRKKGARLLVGVGVLFLAASYVVIRICATEETLPQAVYPDAPVTRPWELIPLALFLFAGAYVFPTFSKWHPSYLSHALWVSVIPHVAAELHMAFGAVTPFDAHFNIAHALKIVAYFAPLHGLRLDYRETYLSEAMQKEALANELLMNEQAVELLHRDRELLEVLLAHSPQAICVKDASLRYLKLNHREAEKLGLAHPAEAIGRRAQEFLPESQAEEIERAERLVLTSGRPDTNRVPLKGKNGRPVGVVTFA